MKLYQHSNEGLLMREFHLIPGYLHFSCGNYSEAMFYYVAGLASCTGVVTDGDLEDGVLIVGAMVVNWGFAVGVSWTGALG